MPIAYLVVILVAELLIAMTRAPPNRFLSLAVLGFDLPILASLGLVSTPLLVAVASIGQVQGIEFSDVGLDLPAGEAFTCSSQSEPLGSSSIT